MAARKAGLVTLARKGIAGEGNREIQLGGEGSREIEVRSNMKTGEEENDNMRGKNNQMFSALRRPREFLSWIFFRSEGNSARR